MKRSYLLASAILVALYGTAPCQGILTENREIPIVAWYGVPPTETTLPRFLELKATGINTNLTTYPDVASMAKALDVARKAGIRLIVSCPELQTDAAGTVRRFRNHPAVAGWMLRDEPCRSDFPALGEWARAIQAVDQRHYCYLNLFPNYANEQQLGTATYREHVALFVKEVPVPFISFDHYPVIGDTLRAGWYGNLEIIADAARQAGKPFWAFALAVAHGPYPVATPAQLRLQVFSDLAYGAQGIQYFTYWTPGGTEWDFHHGPITAEGKRTEVWDHIRQVNAEIRALAPVFLGSRVLWVAHTGKSIPYGTRRLEQLPEPIRRLETEGTGAVVSLLENGGRRYLVIVNRDFLRPMTLTLECAPEVNRILKDGSIVPAAAYDRALVVEAGDVAVLGW